MESNHNDAVTTGRRSRPAFISLPFYRVIPFLTSADRASLAQTARVPLINAGVDVNAVDMRGCTVLMKAARTGCAEVIAMLLAANRAVNFNAATPYGATAMMFAEGHVDATNLLGKVGAGINARLDALNTRYEQENWWVPSLETSKASFFKVSVKHHF